MAALVRNATRACMWSSDVTFLPTDKVTECFKSIPFSRDWRDGTVKSLKTWLPNFVFADAITDTGPPADLRLNILNELEHIEATEFESDVEMQDAFASLFLRAHDGHTVYSKCAPYRNVYYSQPFKLVSSTDGANQQLHLGAEAWPGLLDHLGGDYGSLQGLEVLAIDGAVPITTMTNWAENNVVQSPDEGVRFNVLLMANYFWTRRLQMHAIPEGSVHYLLRDATAPERIIEVTFPWTAINHYGADVDVSAEACAAGAGKELSVEPLRQKPWQMAANSVDSGGLDTPQGWPLVLTNGDSLGLYVSEDNSTGVIKLLNFSPENYTGFCDSAQQALAALAERKSKHLVVDVLGNGGGYVCLGYNFLRLLVPELLDAPPKVYESEYDLPWVEGVSAALRFNATARGIFGLDEYIDAATGEHLTDEDQVAFYDEGPTSLVGDVPHARRSNRFFLDCDEQDAPDFSCDLSPPAVTFSAEQMLVLTDGYCGSTCSTFMHRLQAGSYARVGGVGGIQHLPMESNSFAGGFTSNVARLNAVLQGEDQIPAFPTNGGVSGFAQAEVYDFARRSTPSQYAWSGTDLRFDFWDFQGDLAPLYDQAKASFSDHVVV